MILTKKEIKQRYFDKVYKNAPVVQCACNCGKSLKSKDHYGRDRKYINGHNNRKYDDPKQYKREWNYRNRDKRYKAKTRRARRIKAELIVNAGGKCLCCGLDFDGECTSIFDFHHRDPSKKEFALNGNSINRYSLVKIWAEAEKCDLLCANCHRLIHWEWKEIY